MIYCCPACKTKMDNFKRRSNRPSVVTPEVVERVKEIIKRSNSFREAAQTAKFSLTVILKVKNGAYDDGYVKEGKNFLENHCPITGFKLDNLW